MTGLRPRPAGELGATVRFSYDESGLLEVDVEVDATGATQSHLIESTPGKLTPDQIDRVRQKLAALKVHPREELSNVTALARAEAKYLELNGSDRETLGEATAVFRAAIENEETELIAAMRARLLMLTGED